MDTFSGLSLPYDKALCSTIDIHADILSSLSPDQNSNRGRLKDNIVEIKNATETLGSDPPDSAGRGEDGRQNENSEIKRAKISHAGISGAGTPCTENGAIVGKPEIILLNTSGYTRQEAHQLITQAEDHIERIKNNISTSIKIRNNLKDTLRKRKKIFHDLKSRHADDINFQKDLRLFPSTEFKKNHIANLAKTQKKEQNNQTSIIREIKKDVSELVNKLKTLHQQLNGARQAKLQIESILRGIITSKKPIKNFRPLNPPDALCNLAPHPHQTRV